MHPVLLQLGPLTLHTYGLFAALGFLAGLGLAGALGRRAGIKPTAISEAALPLLGGGLLGARFFYVLFHSGEFQGAWLETLMVWRGGLMWQGGLVGGVAAGFLYFRRRGVPLARAADVLAPAVALGQALGRLGCFFAGCCYGGACERAWAVTFRHPESLAPRGVPLHPTQLYDALLNLAVAGTLLVLLRRPAFRAGKGRAAALYLLLAGLARLAVEPFRADLRGPAAGPLAATGVIALLVAAGGAVALAALRHDPLDRG